jgi:hypothetical protein
LLILIRVSARCHFHESLNWARLVQRFDVTGYTLPPFLGRKLMGGGWENFFEKEFCFSF